MSPRSVPRAGAPLDVVALMALSACGSSGTPTTTGGAAAPQPSVSATATPSSPSASGAASSGSTSSNGAATQPAKVNANTASKSDIAKALENAGIPNSAKWADEIEEYRPYTQGDLTSKLGTELGKYGVDSATLQKILSVLTV